MARDADQLARGEWTVLALVAERPSHGWAVSQLVEEGSEIGQIWAADRQRVYRALRKLYELNLIEPLLIEPGHGAHRTVYRITPAGERRLAEWLSQPVQQMRESSSTFLLKLVFAQRGGHDPTSLVNAQRAIVVAAIESLAHQERRAGGTEKLDVRLRLETARALLNFIDSLSAEKAARTRQPSRRSQLVTGLQREGERATIIVRFDDSRRGILVTTTDVDDPIVAAVEEIAQQAAPDHVSGSG